MNQEAKTDISRSASSNFGARGWILIIIAFFSIMWTTGTLSDSLNYVIPALNEMHGWDTTQLYAIPTIAGWVAVPGVILLTQLAKRVKVRYIGIVSLGVSAVLTYLLGVSNSLVAFGLMFVILMTACNGFSDIANFTMVGNWFPRKKGIAMGWLTIGANLSASIFIPIFTLIMASFGLRGSYTFTSLGLVILMLAVIFLVRDYPEELGKFPDNDKTLTREEVDKDLALALEYKKTSPWTVKKLLVTKQVWLIGVACAIPQFISIGLMAHFVPRMTALGFSVPFCIAAMSICGLIGIFGSWFAGVVDQKIGTRKAASIFTFSYALCVAFNILGAVSWDGFFYISFALIGINLGASSNFFMSLTSSVFGRYDFANAWAVVLPIKTAISCSAFVVISWLATNFGYNGAYGVMTGLGVISAIMMACTDDTCIGRKMVGQK